MRTLRVEFFRNRLDGRAALVPTALRVAAGSVFVILSTEKFFDHAETVEKFVTYGFSDPSVIVYLVGLVELGSGVMLLAGLGTRLAALGLAGDMIGAILTAGLAVGGPIHLGLAPALLLTMLVLLWTGPGALAVDNRVARAGGAIASS